MRKLSFCELEEGVEYKNIHTWNDQVYLKKDGKLFTKSSFSNDSWSTSSASKTNKVFIPFSVERPKRYKL